MLFSTIYLFSKTMSQSSSKGLIVSCIYLDGMDKNLSNVERHKS